MNKSFTFKVCDKIKESWVIYKENLWMFLLMTLLTIVLSSISQDGNFVLKIFVFLATIFISYIWIFNLLDVVKNKTKFKPFSDSSIPKMETFLNLLGATILMGLVIFLGLIFLIIPGLYLMGRLMFTSYLLVDKKQKYSDAIKNSWEMTKGFGWKLFWLSFLVGLFVLLGLAFVFVGIFITYPIGMLVMVMLYRDFYNFKLNINKEDGADEDIQEAEVVEEK